MWLHVRSPVAATTTVTELVDFFRRLGTASVVHSPEERDGVTKAAEVLKDFEVHLAKSFVEAEPQSCLVYSYSFDNKSTLVSSTTSSALAGVPHNHPQREFAV